MYLDQTYGPLRLDDMTDWQAHFERWPSHLPIVAHAESRTLAAVILLAALFDRSVHLAHVSLAEEIVLIRRAKERGLKVTCEVAPHHLFLSQDDISTLSFGRSEVRPRLATPADVQALWDNLDVIDCFATDHAPHTAAEKDGSKPPPGFPGLETALPLLLTAVDEGRMTKDELIARMVTNPRRIFSLPEQPDTWIEVDPDAEYEIRAADAYTRCGWTPFEGRRVRGRVERVVLRGQVAYENGKVVAAPGAGQDVPRYCMLTAHPEPVEGCPPHSPTSSECVHSSYCLLRYTVDEPTMTSFFSRLETRARAINSLLCVGLDPHPADLAAPTAAAARDFCLRLIAATADVAAAFKPNAAFFEQFGAEGMAALRDVIAAVPDEVPVLLDAKRGDIASTAEAYARAAFETLGADAITLSPYLGHDSLEPFLADPARGVFLLCKTSNPGAGDLQDLPLADRIPAQRLFERVAELATGWNTGDNLGLVVGATHPEALAAVRKVAPDLWILAPGVGAQGGDLEAALSAGLRADGLGLLVPVSRQISRAADPRQAARELVEQMGMFAQPGATSRPPSLRGGRQPDEAISSIGTDCFAEGAAPRNDGTLSPAAAALADRLLDAGCVRFGAVHAEVGPCLADLSRPAPAHLRSVPAGGCKFGLC